MNANGLTFLGDYTRLVPTAEYAAGGEPADVRQGPKLFIRDVNIDSLRMDLAASAADVNKSLRHAKSCTAFE